MATVNLRDSVLNARLDITAALEKARATRSTGITCQPVPQFSGNTVNTTCFVSATTFSAVYSITATVTTPGNGGQDADTASLRVVDGPVSSSCWYDLTAKELLHTGHLWCFQCCTMHGLLSRQLRLP